jgi:transposase
MNDREQRGLIIAATSKIQKKGGVYLVPSQSGGNRYTVCLDAENPHCSCPDHETRGVVCKHIHAVQFVIKREVEADGSVTETMTRTLTETIQRKTYPQQWAEYNAAQVNEKDQFKTLLRSLCDQIDLPSVPPRRGRPEIPMDDAIFMACFKVYSTVSGRRFMCDLDDAREEGCIQKTPHFNSIFNALENLELTPILMQLISLAARPLKEIETDFAPDSTGFTSSRFHRWFDHKYGKFQQEHDWVKVHLITGVRTNVVAAAEVHDRNTHDAQIMPSLLNTTAQNFTIREVSADKGYMAAYNFDAVATYGAEPFIAFRANTTAAGGGLFAKAFHYFSLNREEFLAHYHKRSNVESTVSMIKAKFGDHVRSKTEIAMKNEALCKILAHNICCLISAIYELNLRPVFDKFIACTKNALPAQQIARIEG